MSTVTSIRGTPYGVHDPDEEEWASIEQLLESMLQNARAHQIRGIVIATVGAPGEDYTIHRRLITGGSQMALLGALRLAEFDLSEKLSHEGED